MKNEAGLPGRKGRPILLLGEGPLVHELTEILMRQHRRSPVIRLKIGETDDELKETIKKNNIRVIVYSDTIKNSRATFYNLLKLRFKGIAVYDAFSYYQKIARKIPVHCLDVPALFNYNPKAAFFLQIYKIAKRAFDIGLTLLLSPFALVVVFFCALAIKLDSRGPVFFLQERLGLDGKPFKLVKLRTMIDNAEKNTPQWCRDNDPRITRVGRILRKLRLDEVPQLLNVLKNEMSLIGPRPIRRHFTDLLAREIPFYRLRLLAKPGLTGWAQVHSGHANTLESHTQMIQYDLYYVFNPSLWLDFLTLLKTVRVILLGKGR